MMGAFWPGFGLSLGLIAAIGAQNAFVLRQGVLRTHVLAVCLTCALSDAVLIAAGVAGFGALAGRVPWVELMMRLGGAVFLLAYGWRSFCAAWRGGGVLCAAPAGQGQRLGGVLGTTLALTWLNPHVYLDTVVLIGSVAAQYPGHRLAFGLGAITASFVFFLALGFGARFLAPVFARPKAWRVLDLAVGCVMWMIAGKLLWPWIVAQ